LSAWPTQPAHGFPVAMPLPFPFPDGKPTPDDAYWLPVWLLAPGPPGTSLLVSRCGGRVVTLVGDFEVAAAAIVPIGSDTTVVVVVVVVAVTVGLFLALLLTKPLAAPFGSALPEANAAVGRRINPMAKQVAEAPASRRLYPFVVT